MVQVLGRLALSIGILAVAGAVRMAGEHLRSRDGVSDGAGRSGDLGHRRAADPRRRPASGAPIDWRILGGGIAFGAVVLALALGGVPFAQELIFMLSMAVICTHAGLRHARARCEDPARHPVHQHHHLRVSRDAVGRRRLFLVDARRAQVRRGVLRHAASDRGDHRHRGDVDVQQAADGIFRDQGSVLDRGRGHHPVAAQYRAVLRPASLDRGDVRLRRAHHRRSSTRRQPRRSRS